MVKILNCNCDHLFQDSQYGKGRRVHNSIKKEGDKPQKWRCTVCQGIKVS